MHLFSGDNTHHIIEALFKGFARALREAVAFSERDRGSHPPKESCDGG